MNMNTSKLNVGDRVFSTSRGKMIIGFITHKNGSYVYVRPRWAKPDNYIEFYDNELQNLNY